MISQRNVGGTGFTSLGDYLGANGDALDSQYNADATQANGIKDSYESYLGQIPGIAEQASKQTGQIASPASPTGSMAPAYENAVNIENKAAPDMINTLALRTGGGGGANPVSGEDSFNAALQKGAHGGDYSTLAAALGGSGVGSIQKGGAAQAWRNGGELGAEEYVPPAGAPPAQPTHAPLDPVPNAPGDVATRPGGSPPGAPVTPAPIHPPGPPGPPKKRPTDPAIP